MIRAGPDLMRSRFFRLSEQELWRSAVPGLVWIFLGGLSPNPSKSDPNKSPKENKPIRAVSGYDFMGQEL